MNQNTSHAVMAQRHEAHDSLDIFPTPPWATRALCEMIHLRGKSVWEPAAGFGHMVRPLREYSESVIGSDIHNHGPNFRVHESGRFIEVEDINGKSINAGKWHQRHDGLWDLTLLAEFTRPADVVPWEFLELLKFVNNESMGDVPHKKWSPNWNHVLSARDACNALVASGVSVVQGTTEAERALLAFVGPYWTLYKKDFQHATGVRGTFAEKMDAVMVERAPAPTPLELAKKAEAAALNYLTEIDQTRDDFEIYARQYADARAARMKLEQGKS